MRFTPFLLLISLFHFAQAELSFVKDELDVHIKPTQDSFKVFFDFTNKSDKTVEIKKITKHCTCLDVGIDNNKLSYAPGESGKIWLVMRSGSFTGKIDKTVNILTDDGVDKELTIHTYIPEIITMEPRTLSWTEGEPVSSKTITVKIDPKMPMKLTKVSLTGDAFDYEPSTVKEGREYKVKITPKSTAHGAFNTLWIITDCKIPRYSKYMTFLTIDKKDAGK